MLMVSLSSVLSAFLIFRLYPFFINFLVNSTEFTRMVHMRLLGESSGFAIGSEIIFSAGYILFCIGLSIGIVHFVKSILEGLLFLFLELCLPWMKKRLLQPKPCSNT